MKRNGETVSRRRTRLFPEPLQREYDWAFSHYAQLAQRYPNQWVAVANRRVLAGGGNLARVLKQAHEQLDWPHIPHLFVEAGIHFYGEGLRAGFGCPSDVAPPELLGDAGEH